MMYWNIELERAADAHGALELEKTISRNRKRSAYVTFLLSRLGIVAAESIMRSCEEVTANQLSASRAESSHYTGYRDNIEPSDSDGQ